MSLADDYRRQFAWRSWSEILDALPPVAGRTVIDLGCGPGDLSAELAQRGARVVGIDLNRELLDAARARGIPGAEFHERDLHDPSGLPAADGLWGSFVAAYFPNLATELRRWVRAVEPGGWIALTEVDDLFGHEPLSTVTAGLLDAYAEESLTLKRYDFRMGRKLATHARVAGLTVSRELDVGDRELAFDGPASPEVVSAWRDRFARMTALRAFCGDRADAVRDEFLDCLRRADHRCRARVRVCIARVAVADGRSNSG